MKVKLIRATPECIQQDKMTKILSVFRKSLKEQTREFWIVFFVLFTGPFFVFMYFLISESEVSDYRVIIYHEHAKISDDTSLGELIVKELENHETIQESFRFSFIEIMDTMEGLKMLENKKADLMIHIPREIENITDTILLAQKKYPVIEFTGDLTNTNYMLAAVWTLDAINDYITEVSGRELPYIFKETPIGASGSMSDFELWIPGLIVLSIILSLFSASAAFVRESESDTILRLRLSEIKSITFLTGTSLLQIILGFLSLSFTIITAWLLGFHFHAKSLFAIVTISALTSLSIISFSLLLSAFCKTVKDVSIIGTFPMFLMMFFTGAGFPMHVQPLISFAGYDVGWNGILSPTHAVNAVHKILILHSPLKEVMPEIISLLILIAAYFFIGNYLYARRHLNRF